MDGDDLVRHGLELSFVVAVGGMLAAVLRRWWAGRLPVTRCSACGRPTSRGYPRCRHCGAARPDVASDRS